MALDYLELPTLVFGPVEVRRLSRELESLEDYLRQSDIREPGKQAPLPKTSRLLEALAGNNKLNLLLPADRERLATFLANLDKKAPVIHMSFATDPSSAFTAKIVGWLRANIHPYTLLRLGLQPTIVAGCVLRVNSKTFDFSLSDDFRKKRNLLAEALSQVNQPAQQPATTQPQEAAPAS